MNKSGIAGRFVTLVAAILDPASHAVTLVNAGHPPPLIYHRATRSIGEAIDINMAGLPLGVVDGFEYASSRISLEPGDTILTFTDGVTEAMNAQDHQLEAKGVCAAVQGGDYSPRLLAAHVIKVVKQFATGRIQNDDIALVGFGRTALKPAVAAAILR
jgi:sigma-B regulation protein RsbU (phosphoserine phosphatase)